MGTRTVVRTPERRRSARSVRRRVGQCREGGRGAVAWWEGRGRPPSRQQVGGSGRRRGRAGGVAARPRSLLRPLDSLWHRTEIVFGVPVHAPVLLCYVTEI